MTTAINKFEQDLNNNQFKDKWHNNITQNNRKPLFSFSSVKQKLNIVESNKTINFKNIEKNSNNTDNSNNATSNDKMMIT